MGGGKDKLYNTIIVAVGLFGAEIWGPRYLDEAQIIQTKFIKTILQLHRSTPNHMALLEMGTGHI